jgi:hypothetical protein
MFAEPLVVNVGASAVATFATVNLDGQKTNRQAPATAGSPYPISLTIGHQDSKESPLAGGSRRTVIRFSREIADVATGLIVGTEVAQLLLVVPKRNTSTAISISEMAQMVVSFLLAETDGTLSTDATVDSTVVSRLFAGEP